MAAGKRRTHTAVAPQRDVDGVLVRVTVGEGHWAEDIPPVPAGATVTVSFGSPALADEHGEALALLGYDVVEAPLPPDLSIAGVADFLVTTAVMERHPTYWRSLAERATRAYHLALGPAATAVADVVGVHAARLTRALR